MCFVIGMICGCKLLKENIEIMFFFFFIIVVSFGFGFGLIVIMNLLIFFVFSCCMVFWKGFFMLDVCFLFVSSISI